MRLEILAVQKPHVVAGHHRHILRRRQRHGVYYETPFAAAAGAYDCHVDAIAERLAPALQAVRRGFAIGECGTHIAGAAQ